MQRHLWPDKSASLRGDLADPESNDAVVRESTRLWAAAPGQAQTSLDPKQMREWIPGITYGAHAFGIEPVEDREAQFEAFLAARDNGKPARRYGNPVEFFIAKLKKE
jgi:hypothetical protein